VCGTEIIDASAIPTCRDCGMAIARHFKPELLLEDRFAHEARMTKAVDHRAKLEQTPEGGCVYYVRIEDYIKIGWTAQLRSRMRALRVDASKALLAIEPGTKELERQRHQEFAHERIHNLRENFFPTGRLIDHIGVIHAANELPSWTRIPDTNQVTIRRSAKA
jgi:hypothetical protein